MCVAKVWRFTAHCSLSNKRIRQEKALKYLRQTRNRFALVQLVAQVAFCIRPKDKTGERALMPLLLMLTCRTNVSRDVQCPHGLFLYNIPVSVSML